MASISTPEGAARPSVPQTCDNNAIQASKTLPIKKFGEVEPLVFGHFGELNARFHTLMEKTAGAAAALYHREHGWKLEE